MIDKIQIKKLVESMKHISIIEDNICKLEEHKHLLDSHWLEDPAYNFKKLSEEEVLLFLLILDSTSFSYWGDPNWKVDYKGKKVNGARAMILSLKKAVDKGTLKLSAEHIKNLSRKTYRKILKGTTEIPLFEERYQIIKEIGEILTDKFGGKVKNLIKLAKGDALKLVKILVESFDFFKDFIVYEDEVVELNKKAQLFVLDVHRTFKKNKIGKLKNIRKLTACADYKLPQVLRRMNIFEYSPELAKRIDNHVLLPSDSLEEIEIRLKTILAVELIKDYFNQKLKLDIKSHQVNELLWMLGQIKHAKDKPYHKVRTIRY